MAKSLTKTNIPQKIIDDHLPGLFASYNKAGVSSWLCWMKSGKVLERFSYVCHASMIYDGTGWDDLITAVIKPTKTNLSYQQMLINGPFRAFSDLISLDHIGENYFIYCSNLEKWPANVIYNYCIATRVPREHAEYLDYWSKLCNEGYDPTLAFLLSYSMGGDASGSRDFLNRDHFWFDVNADWKRILSGNMTRMAGNFKENNKSCIPCNKIWGTSEHNKQLINMTNEEIAEFFGMSPLAPIKFRKINTIPPKKKNPYLLAIAQVAQQQVHDAQMQQAQGLPVHWQHIPLNNQPQIHMEDFDDPIFDQEGGIEIE